MPFVCEDNIYTCRGGSVVISKKINIVSVLYRIDGLAQTNVCINKATQTTQREDSDNSPPKTKRVAKMSSVVNSSTLAMFGMSRVSKTSYWPGNSKLVSMLWVSSDQTVLLRLPFCNQSHVRLFRLAILACDDRPLALGCTP